MGEKPKNIERECKKHGFTLFFLECGKRYRCKKCRSMHVSKRRAAIKLKLVEEFGGCCQKCGYNKCVRALHFHHKNPKEKLFSISGQGQTRSLDRTRREAEKCILLCSNCHAEVEEGITKI